MIAVVCLLCVFIDSINSIKRASSICARIFQVDVFNVVCVWLAATTTHHGAVFMTAAHK